VNAIANEPFQLATREILAGSIRQVPIEETLEKEEEASRRKENQTKKLNPSQTSKSRPCNKMSCI